MKIKKLTILAQGNEGTFSYIIVEKHKEFFKWLSEVVTHTFIQPPDVEEEEEYRYKQNIFVRKSKDIKKFVDRHEHFSTKEGRVDIYYGKDKVYISFIISQSMRKMLMKSLAKCSVYRKSKKSSNDGITLNWG